MPATAGAALEKPWECKLPVGSNPGSGATSGQEMIQYSTRCNEPWAVDGPARLVGTGSFEYHSDLENARWWQYVCPLIPKAGAAAGSEQLTKSPVPVLAFNGHEDPQDPPR